MSSPPVGVTVVDYSGDEEVVMATAAFDGVSEALTAVEVLLRLWSFDAEDERRIEVQRV